MIVRAWLWASAAALAAIALVCACAAARKTASTVELGYSRSAGELAGVRHGGQPGRDMDSSAAWISVRPLAALEPPTVVRLEHPLILPPAEPREPVPARADPPPAVEPPAASVRPAASQAAEEPDGFAVHVFGQRVGVAGLSGLLALLAALGIGGGTRRGRRAVRRAGSAVATAARAARHRAGLLALAGLPLIPWGSAGSAVPVSHPGGEIHAHVSGRLILSMENLAPWEAPLTCAGAGYGLTWLQDGQVVARQLTRGHGASTQTVAAFDGGIDGKGWSAATWDLSWSGDLEPIWLPAGDYLVQRTVVFRAQWTYATWGSADGWLAARIYSPSGGN